jgi:hypothetical protein
MVQRYASLIAFSLSGIISMPRGIVNRPATRFKIDRHLASNMD